jgi:glycolate dehydrogenase FAD-binding subunit
MALSVIAPADEAELADAIQAAVADKAPLELVGIGTKRVIGRPMQVAATLDLGRFTGISAYEPEELVLTAGAATPLAEIDEALSACGQAFAFEPPDLSRLLGGAHAGSLGGLLNANLSGPRRIKAGAARDHVLGMTAVSGRGEVFKGGGRVVKNVTGYDMPKLLANSWGTLAALTSVTFKVLPKPEAEETLVIAGLNDEDAIGAMSLAMQSSCEISAAAHLPAEVASSLNLPDAATLLRLEGIPPSIAYRRDRLQQILKGLGTQSVATGDHSFLLWRTVRDVLPFARNQDRPVWRLSIPPSQGARTFTSIRSATDARCYYDWAGGLIWLELAPLEDGGAQLVRSAVIQGHATLIRAPQHVRAIVNVFQPQPEALAQLTRRVKTAFDPAGILNPGRMYQG